MFTNIGLVNRSIKQQQSIDQLISQFIVQSVKQSINQSIYQSSNQSTYRSSNQSIYGSISQPTHLPRLTNNQWSICSQFVKSFELDISVLLASLHQIVWLKIEFLSIDLDSYLSDTDIKGETLFWTPLSIKQAHSIQAIQFEWNDCLIKQSTNNCRIPKSLYHFWNGQNVLVAPANHSNGIDMSIRDNLLAELHVAVSIKQSNIPISIMLNSHKTSAIVVVIAFFCKSVCLEKESQLLMCTFANVNLLWTLIFTALLQLSLITLS